VWLLFARRNLPFISVADSFMAVLFATAADNIARTADEDTSLLGTLGAAMFMCSVVSAAGYVAVGSARVCNIVQFVPSPVMAGYQASIGYLLLDSAATLASGCSLMTPQCFYQRPWAVTELVFGAGLGIVLQVAQRHTDDSATRSMLMPALLIITSLLFQLLKLVLPTDLVDLQAWSLEIPSQQSIFTLGADLDIGNINWSLAAHEALLTTATAFVPNLLGKLLQYSALESKFDTDVDYNQEIRHAGWSQLVASPAMMVPTVTYLGMVVAHDMGARSFVPPAMVVGTSAALVFSGSYIVTLVPKAMFAALLFTSGLNLIYDNLKTAYSDLQRREFALVVLHIGLTAVLGMLSAVVYHMASCTMRKLKIDDPLDAWAVHGACGFWGVLAVGLFAVKEYAADGFSVDDAGIFMSGTKGELFGAQILALLIEIPWVVTTTFILFSALKAAKILRVPPDEEMLGLDISKHGGGAYIVSEDPAQPKGETSTVQVQPRSTNGAWAE
jgi:MFS superfamily sulfate permease-like transporter